MSISIAARFYDGAVAESHSVNIDYEAYGSTGNVLVRNPGTGDVMARWAAADIAELPTRKGELRLSATSQPAGSRIVVNTPEDIARVRATLPILEHKQRLEFGKQVRIGFISTLALASVITAYIFGVPLLASRIVGLVPPEWETRMGDTVAEQMEASLKEEGGFEICDTDPNSLANRAIARFGVAALEGTGSPFTLDIKVVKTEVPNAFALPGGRVYFFSSLLDRAETPDEFAGVLAHEVGHVAHRHGMEQLISTAGTGALIGFILGDMTGISVAAGLGATLIDSRFSRDAERQADQFAANVAGRMDFQPAGLADLLDRVAEDDEFTQAMALLSTHPLTSDRRTNLVALTQQPTTGLEPPFSAAEWTAIKTMCDNAGTPMPTEGKIKSK